MSALARVDRGVVSHHQPRLLLPATRRMTALPSLLEEKGGKGLGDTYGLLGVGDVERRGGLEGVLFLHLIMGILNCSHTYMCKGGYRFRLWMDIYVLIIVGYIYCT